MTASARKTTHDNGREGLQAKAMPRPKQPPGTLTSRQLEIIRLVSTGEEDKQIAHRLGIAPITVRNHLKNIRRVMGNLNRVQLAVWFIENKKKGRAI